MINIVKRIVKGIVLFLVLSIVMCGCEKTTKTQELSENIEAYETKVLGLVYSSNPKSYIESLKEWYNGMDSERINENWYTVGQWMHN